MARAEGAAEAERGIRAALVDWCDDDDDVFDAIDHVSEAADAGDEAVAKLARMTAPFRESTTAFLRRELGAEAFDALWGPHLERVGDAIDLLRARAHADGVAAAAQDGYAKAHTEMRYTAPSEASEAIEQVKAEKHANHARTCPDCRRPRITTTKRVALREIQDYCLRDYAGTGSDADRLAACAQEDALQDCRDATRPVDAVLWILERVASWTPARWDQHVSDRYGDEVVRRVRDWLDRCRASRETRETARQPRWLLPLPRWVVRGLFRAAEFKEQHDECRELWDDDCRRAVEWMRANVADHAGNMPASDAPGTPAEPAEKEPSR